MFITAKSALVVVTLLAAPATIAVSASAPASAAGTYYSSCDDLHRDFAHGVALDQRSAAKQIRDGYGRPATGKRAKAVYRTNSSRLDRDRDGTACES